MKKNLNSERNQASLVGQIVKNLSSLQEIWIQSLGPEVPLEKGVANHSSILAWRIPWTKESWDHEELDTTEKLPLKEIRI